MTIIEEMMQAMLNESAVLFINDKLKEVNLNKTINAIILIICSRNSVKLIEKNSS